MNTSFYDLIVQNAQNKPVSMKQYSGKVLLIVNVASKCGFTPQYDGLEALYKKYEAKGLVILGFPCNQFGGQEPGTNAEIKQFAQGKYGVQFPLFSKIDVNGPNAIDVYKYLRFNSELYDPTTKEAKEIPWNFGKFLVDAQGHVKSYHEPKAQPLSLTKEIEEMLAMSK